MEGIKGEMSCLSKAILQENISEVKRILEEKPSSIDEKDENGTLMALLAAKTGNLDLVKYIVEYSRASMNIYDSVHRSMLHYAAMSGNVDTCRYLTERVGLSPLEGELSLETPYEIAHKEGFYELEEYFKDYTGASLDRMYHNPIRTGMYPDPSIVRVGDTYYMVNSSFIYFPCIPVSMSKDLIHWKIIGHAITNPEWVNLDDLEGGRGYWAPDISFYEGKFYITATYRLNDDGNVYRKQIVVSSNKPEGPYSKPAIIDEDGIDPSIFNDDDGRRYMLLNRGARIFELNHDATRQISKAELLFYGDHKRAPEGPHLLKKDGYYYLFEAEGGTGPGHRITVSRSRTLKGIYKPCPYNPIMRQNDENAIIQRCGHGKPVQTQKGDWYMVYLCGRKIGDGYSILGRETALDPIRWTDDGWPIVNELNGPSALQIKPDLPEMVWKKDDDCLITEGRLSLDWMTPRPPEADGVKIYDSILHIKGSRYDLDSMKARNILVRRQEDFCFRVISGMRTDEIKPYQDAGITCYYDENTFLKLGVFGLDNGKKTVKVIEHVGDDTRECAGIALPEGVCKVFFKVETMFLERKFYVSFDGREYQSVAKLDNVYYLCDEGLKKGKRFTGATVGVYAYGGNKPLIACFESFKYEPLTE